MKKTVENGYAAPVCRILTLSLQHPVMGLSDYQPGMPGYYDSDDDIIIPGVF
jgi:hypothetical protein